MQRRKNKHWRPKSVREFGLHLTQMCCTHSSVKKNKKKTNPRTRSSGTSLRSCRIWSQGACSFAAQKAAPPCTLLGPASPRLVSARSPILHGWRARSPTWQIQEKLARCSLNGACARGRHGARQHARVRLRAVLEKKVSRRYQPIARRSREQPSKLRCLEGLTAARSGATLKNAWAVVVKSKPMSAHTWPCRNFRKLKGRIEWDARQAIGPNICLTVYKQWSSRTLRY